MAEIKYIAAGTKSWHEEYFKNVLSRHDGQWHFISHPSQLNEQFVREISPKYLFFLHWSWKVPESIYSNYECVCFHMTDLPYGRGGTPLQNLILKGHENTKISAFKMVAEMDAGPVYMKEELSLDGSAEEIYIRATSVMAGMIHTLIKENPDPLPQDGSPVVFRRRKPEESKIQGITTLEKLYDYVRMLDAEGYPNAFCESNGFKFEFRDAKIIQGCVEAKVIIKKNPERKAG